jgi:hypothetical protein
MAAFGPLDYLLIFFLVLGTVWGLLRGAGRLLISLFSLYVGLILSLWLYRPLANYLRSLLPGMSVNGSEALAFVFLLLVLVNGFAFFTEYFSTPPEERKRKKRGEVHGAEISDRPSQPNRRPGGGLRRHRRLDQFAIGHPSVRRSGRMANRQRGAFRLPAGAWRVCPEADV